ncbi:MAG: hypothetical protein ABI237_05005 [Ginsengibacter sp.]
MKEKLIDLIGLLTEGSDIDKEQVIANCMKVYNNPKEYYKSIDFKMVDDFMLESAFGTKGR